MAAKTKPKFKAKAKPVKKAAPARKSSVSKVKAAKPAPRKAVKPVVKAAPKVASRSHSKPSKGKESQPKAAPAPKVRSKEYASAIHAYESALKLMHGEHYERAIKAFNELVAQHKEEPEIGERARMLMNACEKKLHEKSRSVFKSADDHYNMAIAELNRRDLDGAAQHLQQALKLSPKADHILYAMAAVNALKGNRDEALSFLKQSIHYRAENRFMAARDTDFQGLNEDADFQQLVTPAEK